MRSCPTPARGRAGLPWLISACVLAAFCTRAAADEIVETLDGRKLLLRSDGIYEFLSRLDPAILDRALATAKEWAQDQTLIAYCFRNHSDREILTGAFGKDRDEAIARLRHGGAAEQQLRRFTLTIAENFRAPEPGAEDKASSEACTTKDVEKSVFTLSGVGVPLFMRPPFRELK
jgi:hypothetical protein